MKSSTVWPGHSTPPSLPAGVRFRRRSPRLDRNETLGREIYDAFTAEVVADVYLLAHATSPFIRPATIAAALHKVTDEGKTRTRVPVIIAGVVFVVLGFIPKAGAVLSLIPSPVIGGIFLPAAASLISTGFNTLRKVESDDRTQVVIGLSLLLGIALPNALSGLEGGAHVFFSNSILVGAFSVVILKALIIDLPNFIARHADERTKQAE